MKFEGILSSPHSCKRMAEKLTKDTILNIPQLNRGNNATTTTSLTPNTSSRATPTAPASSEVSEQDFDPSEADEFEDGGIGEFDDGRSGKITLGVLIQDGVIEAGDGVMAVDYLGQTFKGDLLTNGKIKSQETGLVFNNPSAWAIYCKKIVNPSKKSGCGESKEFITMYLFTNKNYYIPMALLVIYSKSELII